MFNVKPIPDSDIDRVLEIYSRGVEEGRSTFNTEVPGRRRWDESHLKICRLGAYLEDGTLAGWIALSPTSSRRCYAGVTEVSLYVDRPFRGRGVGKLLMKSLVEESEKRGIWSLYAAIFSTNEASIKVCLDNGWRKVGIRERIAKDRFGRWQDTVIMERRSKVAGAD